jgi:hypothetical protein
MDPNGMSRRGDRQHAIAYGRRSPPFYATLPLQSVDAALDGLSHTAIATALQVLAVAQSFASKHDRRGEPISTRIEMRWLCHAARLHLRTVMGALDELLRPLPGGWPPILKDLATRPGEIRCTADGLYSSPRPPGRRQW